jgi:hypothetical protein
MLMGCTTAWAIETSRQLRGTTVFYEDYWDFACGIGTATVMGTLYRRRGNFQIITNIQKGNDQNFLN